MCIRDSAYSVHDVEDGIVSGRVSLRVLWDFVELAALAEKGAAAFGGDADSLVDAADRLRSLPAIAAAAEFDYTLSAWTGLKALTSQLVGRYVGAVTRATREDDGNRALADAPGAAASGAPGLGLGRQHGRLVVPPDVEAEVRLLKTVAVLYVMDQPSHQARQDRQRDRIYRVHEYLRAGAPGSLDTMFQAWFIAAETDLERERVIVDQIASMTESRLERTAKKAAAFEGYF